MRFSIFAMSLKSLWRCRGTGHAVIMRVRLSAVSSTMLLGSIAALGVAGCGDNDHGTTGFHAALTDEEATLTIGGSLLWYWNEIPESEFHGWFTDPGTVWHETVANARLTLNQNATTQLGARLVLDGGFELAYSDVELNPASRIIYPPHTTGAVALDRVEVGLDVGRASRHCSLEYTRLIVSLSSFPDGENAIMARAAESAAKRGVPAPTTWDEVVHDREIYHLLFQDYATVGLATSTFAYISAYLLPTCDDRRMFFVTEADLVGPVTPPAAP